MAYLFISYPRRQAEVVTRLQALLEARSIEVWRDTEQLRFGTAWDSRVTAAIRGAAMVVLFQSEDWFASGPCRSEADQARYYHRPIVTLSAHDEALDLEAAAAFVAGRFAARPPEGDVVADLEVQAAQWAEGGRRVRDLARRQNLRRFVPLTSRADTVTELAEDFVRQSRRWRRIVRLALATLAVGVITSGAFVTLGAYQTARVDEADRANGALLAQRATFEAALAASPYAGAEAALAEDASSDGYTTLVDAQQALERCVPVAYMAGGGAPTASGATVDAEAFAFPEAGRAEASGAGWYATSSPNRRNLYVRRTDAAGAVSAAPAVTVALDAPCDDIVASPDGRTLAVVTARGVELFDPKLGTCFTELTGAPTSKGCVLAWSADGERLAMRAPDGSAAVWEPHPRTTVTAHTGLWFMDGVSAVGGAQAVFLARDGSLAVVDATTGELLGTETCLVDTLTLATDIAPGISANEVYVVGADTEGAPLLCLVDLTAHTAQPVAVPEDLAPLYVATSPEAGIMALSDGAQTVVLDLASGEEERRIEGVSVSALAVDVEGRVFIGSLGGGGLSVVEPGSIVPAKTEAVGIDGISSTSPTPGASPRALAVGATHAVSVGDGFAENGSLALTNVDGSWRLTTGYLAFWTPTQAQQARALAVSPDGSVFAAGFSDGTVAFLRESDLCPGSTVREQASEVRALAFSPDGSAVIAAMRDGTIARVTVDEGAFDIATLHERLQQRLDTARALGLR